MREEATWQASYDYWRMADIVDTPSTVFYVGARGRLRKLGGRTLKLEEMRMEAEADVKSEANNECVFFCNLHVISYNKIR